VRGVIHVKHAPADLEGHCGKRSRCSWRMQTARCIVRAPVDVASPSPRTRDDHHLIGGVPRMIARVEGFIMGHGRRQASGVGTSTTSERDP